MNYSDVTFVIPTRARSPKLDALLKDLLANDSVDLEVLVVLNGVSESNEDYEDDYRLKVVFCPLRGLTYGRFHGAECSRRRYVWYFDDDVRIPEGFFKAFEQLNVGEGTAYGGGPLLLAPWISIPGWCQDCFMLHDLSISNNITRPQLPVGANCFCLREALLDLKKIVLGSPYILDRDGDSLLSCGDTFLWILMKERRLIGPYWAADIAVLHDIAISRLDIHWFRERAKWQGLSTLYLERNLGRLRLMRRMLIWLSKAGILYLSIRLDRIFGRRTDWKRERMFLVTRQAVNAPRILIKRKVAPI